jgi:hypothetical protein
LLGGWKKLVRQIKIGWGPHIFQSPHYREETWERTLILPVFHFYPSFWICVSIYL